MYPSVIEVTAAKINSKSKQKVLPRFQEGEWKEKKIHKRRLNEEMKSF